jgi:hypothetical protein
LTGIPETGLLDSAVALFLNGLNNQLRSLPLLALWVALAAAAPPAAAQAGPSIQVAAARASADTVRTEVAQKPDAEKDTSALDRFSLEGYGVVNYLNYDWQTQPDRKDVIDLERVVLYPSYQFGERLHVRAEVEIEHGGTGATKEFERFEEAGEFETEVEQGGEVVLEQLNLEYAWKRQLGVRLGRVKVPVGLAATHDEPPEYFTTTRSQAETSVIPVNWYENGLQAYGRLGPGGRVRYTASFVNGLDAAGFSSRRWVATGHQTRFEQVRAESFAGALRLDYAFGGARKGFGANVFSEESVIGLSAYRGGSAANRPTDDLPGVSAAVTIVEAHLSLGLGPLIMRALALGGDLENADRVSQANRSLPSALGAPGTPVGSEARAYLAEAGYDVFSFVPALPGRLDLFGRYEFYDTLAAVAGPITDNPRYERTAYTGGLNYHVIDDIVLKAQYTHRTLGLDTDDTENTFSAGFGFEF